METIYLGDGTYDNTSKFINSRTESSYVIDVKSKCIKVYVSMLNDDMCRVLIQLTARASGYNGLHKVCGSYSCLMESRLILEFLQNYFRENPLF